VIKNASCIYTSKTETEAKEDLCDYIGLEDFSKIESELFSDEEKGNITSFNFKALMNTKTK